MTSRDSIVRRLRRLAVRLAMELAGRLVVMFGLHRSLLRGGAIVVAFHSITKERSTDALRCSAKDFDAYCRFFSRHLACESFDRTVARLQANESLDGQLSITFDDGYADNAELALPILNRYRLHATVYVATGFIESNTQTFWDQGAALTSRWMTWQQLQEWSASGHEVGAHTVNHVDLGKVSLAEGRRELEQSKQEIESRLGRPVRHFAIPFGRSFESIADVVAVAKSMGYQSVTLCRGGLLTRANSDLCIERWPIDPTQYFSPYGWMMGVIREHRRARVVETSRSTTRLRPIGY